MRRSGAASCGSAAGTRCSCSGARPCGAAQCRSCRREASGGLNCRAPQRAGLAPGDALSYAALQIQPRLHFELKCSDFKHIQTGLLSLSSWCAAAARSTWKPWRRPPSMRTATAAAAQSYAGSGRCAAAALRGPSQHLRAAAPRLVDGPRRRAASPRRARPAALESTPHPPPHLHTHADRPRARRF